MRRGQISIEYILLLAFTFAVLIPGIFFFYGHSQRSSASVHSAQFVKVGQQMLAMAVQASAQGEGSWLTLEVNLPSSIDDINVSNDGAGTELVITYDTSAGRTTAVFFTDIPLAANSLTPPPNGLNGSIFTIQPHEGRASFRFVSGGGAVGIKEYYG